ncbi:MAG: acetyl-CoA carboxylase biotin carboxyl carrier protein [Rhodospirillales bacterium]|nr:acetyl-CoA carboxylase biotin carboxyl carrier protein [Rhodospirillales bacterium]
MSKEEFTIDGALVRTLAGLLEETGLSEIEYAVGDKRIRVARAASPVTAILPAATGATPGAAPAPETRTSEHPGAVKSPMVGTAYLAPQPGAPPFIKVGDKVAEGDVLLIVEAMKVMNQIRAPRAGRVIEIAVADGTPVEFGQVLVILE